MKKKIIIGIVAAVAVIGLIVLAIIVSRKITEGVKASGTTDDTSCVYSKEVKVLNNSFPSDIVVYGEDVDFHNSLTYRTIDKITEENIKGSGDYQFTFLVIVDRNGKLDISDEEFNLIKKLNYDGEISFYYVGEHYLKHLDELDFYSGLYGDDTMGIANVVSPFGNKIIEGFWTSVEEEHFKENNELLAQALVYSFVDDVIKAFG